MMKKTTFLSIFLGLTFFSGVAHASFYGGIGAGVSLNDGSVITPTDSESYKNTPIYTLAAGHELPLPILDIRGEAEYVRIRPKVKNEADSKLDAAFLNGYADIPLVPIVDPYVGAGIGYARFDHTNSVALQGMAGVEYEVPFLPIAFGAEYRYLKVNETGGKWDSSSKFHTNILMMKARYAF